MIFPRGRESLVREHCNFIFKEVFLSKKEFVSVLMESPFYFDTPLRERLWLLKYNERRFAEKACARIDAPGVI